MRWSLVVPLMVLAGGAPNPPAEPSDCDKHQHPFIVPEDSLHRHVRTIALRGTFTPLTLRPEVESRMVVLDTMLQAILGHRGYRLVDARTTDSVWAAALDSVGPMFDPVSGQRDSTKWKAAQQSFRHRLQDGHGVDAILYPSVRAVTARFSGKTAEWDGTTQATTSFGSTLGDALLGTSYSGRVPALSFRAWLVSADGDLLYDNFGGIQLVQLVSHGKFSDVPDSLILTSRERLAGAVKVALCQFLAAPPSPGS